MFAETHRSLHSLSDTAGPVSLVLEQRPQARPCWTHSMLTDNPQLVSLLQSVPPAPLAQGRPPSVCLSPPGPHWAGWTCGRALATSHTQDQVKSQHRAGHSAAGINEGHALQGL